MSGHSHLMSGPRVVSIPHKGCSAYDREPGADDEPDAVPAPTLPPMSAHLQGMGSRRGARYIAHMPSPAAAAIVADAAPLVELLTAESHAAMHASHVSGFAGTRVIVLGCRLPRDSQER